MMIISDIRPTKRGRYALFVDGEFLFSVDGETLAVKGLNSGDVLDETQLEALRNASDERKVKDAALRYLSLRAYGEKELYQKLLLRYDEHSCAAAIASMRELELLNDEQFSKAKAEGMAGRKKTGREIRMKLYSLGIERQVADDAVDALSIDGAEIALQMIEKKYIQALQSGEKQKVMAALARRGFSYSEIQQAMQKALLACGENSEDDGGFEQIP